MRTMHAIALGAAIGLAMAGCTVWETVPTPDPDTAADAVDGLWCGDPAHESSTKVYVNVRYADDGMPSASPDVCEVRRDTQVTWRGPADGAASFALDFPGGPPGRGRLASAPAPETGRQKVILWATGEPGTYKYGITANGKRLDPDLKIKPN